MRKDIKINTQTGNLSLDDALNDKEFLEFEVVRQDEHGVYGQVIIPQHLNMNVIEKSGVFVKIPYIPVYKDFYIRFVAKYGINDYIPIINPSDNSEWYPVYSNIYDEGDVRIKASQLVVVNEDEYFIKVKYMDEIKKYAAFVWSAKQTDFSIVNANIQNRNLLLRCVPTNSYRYPSIGVGLIRYINANIEQTNLAQVIQSQFAADGVRVLSASFDSRTGNLDLNLDFSEVDEKV